MRLAHGPDAAAAAATGFTPGQVKALDTIVVILAVLGVLASAAVVVHYWMFRPKNTVTARMVNYLCWATLGSSIMSFAVGVSGTAVPGASCTAEAFFLHTFYLSSVLWTAALSVVSYQLVVLMTHKDQLRRREPFWLLLCVGVPLATSTGAAAAHRFGPAGELWCWIAGPRDPLRWLLFYVPLFIVIAVVATMSILLLKHVRQTMAASQFLDVHRVNPEQRVSRKVQLYLGNFLVCWLFPVINRVQNAAAPDKPVFALYALDLTATALYPLLTSAIYGWSEAMLTDYRKSLRRRVRLWLRESAPARDPLRVYDDPNAAAAEPLISASS